MRSGHCVTATETRMANIAKTLNTTGYTGRPMNLHQPNHTEPCRITMHANPAETMHSENCSMPVADNQTANAASNATELPNEISMNRGRIEIQGYFANTTSSCALGLAEAGAVMMSHGISITLFKPSRTHLRFSCTTCSPRLPKYLRMYFSTDSNTCSSLMPERDANGVTRMKMPTRQTPCMRCWRSASVATSFAIFTVSR